MLRVGGFSQVLASVWENGFHHVFTPYSNQLNHKTSGYVACH